MANLLDALNMVANRANDEQQKQKPSTLSKQYVDKNRKDLQKTFQTDPESDYNEKIRKALGVSG